MKTAAKPEASKAANLMVRLDPASKKLLQRVASLRGVSTSDYVRSVVIANARRDLAESERSVLSLTAEEQANFWQALSAPAELTSAQKRLSAIMRGKK